MQQGDTTIKPILQVIVSTYIFLCQTFFKLTYNYKLHLIEDIQSTSGSVSTWQNSLHHHKNRPVHVVTLREEPGFTFNVASARVWPLEVHIWGLAFLFFPQLVDSVALHISTSASLVVFLPWGLSCSDLPYMWPLERSTWQELVCLKFFINPIIHLRGSQILVRIFTNQ